MVAPATSSTPSIAADFEEIAILVVDAANDNGAMRSMVENSIREALNPVDGIERLIALGWTEEAIAVALALPVRQIRKLRLLANVLPAMLEQIALGEVPSEQQLRVIAAAGQVDQKEVRAGSRITGRSIGVMRPTTSSRQRSCQTNTLA